MQDDIPSTARDALRASPTAHCMFWMKISKTQQNGCGSAQHFAQHAEAKKPLHILIPALDWSDILIGSGGCYYFFLFLIILGSCIWVGLGIYQ